MVQMKWDSWSLLEAYKHRANSKECKILEGYNRVYHFCVSTQSIIWDVSGIKEPVTKKLETRFHVS